MEENDQAHSDNPNLVFFSTYINMVGILLDLFRVDRDGKYILHLDALTDLLPWLTIYDHTNFAWWGPVSLHEKTIPEVHK